MSCDKPAAGEEVGTSREWVQHGMATHAALQATHFTKPYTPNAVDFCRETPSMGDDMPVQDTRREQHKVGPDESPV